MFYLSDLLLLLILFGLLVLLFYC
ncbi:hypothetical protein [Flavobacterium hercynium]